MPLVALGNGSGEPAIRNRTGHRSSAMLSDYERGARGFKRSAWARWMSRATLARAAVFASSDPRSALRFDSAVFAVATAPPSFSQTSIALVSEGQRRS